MSYLTCFCWHWRLTLKFFAQICRHIVGLAGPPGAGKSTVASEVVKRINKLWPQKSCSFDSQVQPPEVATVLPMDGFHLYRHQLDAMEVNLSWFQLAFCFYQPYSFHRLHFSAYLMPVPKLFQMFCFNHNRYRHPHSSRLFSWNFLVNPEPWNVFSSF